MNINVSWVVAAALGLVSPRQVLAHPRTESGGDAEQPFVSKKYAYRWQLPPGWKFVPAGRNQPREGAEVTVARRVDTTSAATATLIVADFVSVVPGKVLSDDPDEARGLEKYGRDKLLSLKAGNITKDSVEIAAGSALRLRGKGSGEHQSYRSMILFERGSRRFEILCVADQVPSETDDEPCRPALTKLTVDQRAETPRVEDVPRKLVLRGQPFGIFYQPPSEEWLGLGPRQGFGGKQKVWIWNHRDRQIDVAAFDVREFPAYPDGDALAAKMADRFRANGAGVTIGKASFSGLSWSHLEMSPKTGDRQDLFIHRRGNVVYSLLITQPMRDLSFIHLATVGFRLDGAH